MSDIKRWNVISSLVNALGFERGAEIGVAYGQNLFNVLDACPRLHMFAVDMWHPVEDVSDAGPKGLFGYPKMDHESNKRVVYDRAKGYGDRATIMEMESTVAATSVEDASLDFVFIDACHAKAEVMVDIRAWAGKVRPGGLIMGHDIHYPTVRAAVEETLGEYQILQDDVWSYNA